MLSCTHIHDFAGGTVGGGLTIDNTGLVITSGGFTVTNGDVTISGDVTANNVAAPSDRSLYLIATSILSHRFLQNISFAKYCIILIYDPNDNNLHHLLIIITCFEDD